MSASPSATRQWLKDYIEKERDTLLVSLRLYVIRSGLATYQSPQEIADELMHDVVREALRHADRLDSTQVTKAWLLGIATNLIKRKNASIAKRNHREPLARDLFTGTSQAVMSDDEIFDLLAMQSVINPAEEFESNEQIAAILGHVSEDDQQIIKLAILNEMNGVLIAKELGITPECARMRLHRAMKRLRKAYGNNTRLDD